VTPAAVSLPVPDATYMERFEGMLVTFAQPLYVTENYYLGRFGQVTVSGGGRLDQPTAVTDPGAPALALDAANQLDKVIVDDAVQTQNPDPIVFGRGGSPLSASNTLRGGDTITGLTGVMTYTWSGDATSGNAWRVRPVTSMSGYYNFAASNPRPTAAPAVGGSVKIAGMNLLNYYNTFTGCTYGVGGVPGDCRGAENATEFTRQWQKTVAAIVALDADVLGVVELENDGYGASSAIQDLVTKLNAAAGAGTYAFIDVDTNTGLVNALGVDGIRNGLLYQPARVTPVGTTAVLNSVAFVNGGDSAPRNRVSLLQAFEDISTGGIFLVNVNHLKSKGSACDAPDALDGQGNCNIVRVNAANALVSWFATDPTGTDDPDIVMLGDLNSYAKEDPIETLEAGGFINSAHAFLGEDAYSYVFNEYVGGLDYAMVSPTFYTQTSGVQEWHINADEPVVLDYNTNYKSPAQLTSLYDTSFYRVSDHDPVVVGFNPDGSGPTAAVTDPLNGTIFTEVVINELTVTFSEDVVHDGGEFAANNPINYMLVEQGFNNLFDTVTCDVGVQTDDVTIAINSIAYDPATLTAVLSVNGGTALPEGDYRLFVCGTSSIRDLRGNILNGGLYDTYSDFGIRWPLDAASVASATALPATGFAPDRVTELPAQTVKYAGLGDLWLEIPSLKVKTAIVGVPLSDGTWDVTWLGSQAGWLEGSAYPTALGNSVLTAHVWDAVNKPGAFYGLNKLGFGDRVIVHSYGKTYTYEVRRVMSVNPSRVDAMLKHQEDAWLTLVTCQGYDADTDEYAYRTLVRAVLVDVK
jgi:LPXTG-site transpeptidase (sortase) family protein